MNRLYLGQWHDWFAWRPVRVAGRWVWLVGVKRQINCKATSGGVGYCSVYRKAPRGDKSE